MSQPGTSVPTFLKTTAIFLKCWVHISSPSVPQKGGKQVPFFLLPHREMGPKLRWGLGIGENQEAKFLEGEGGIILSASVLVFHCKPDCRRDKLVFTCRSGNWNTEPHLQLGSAGTRSRHQFLWLLIQCFFHPPQCAFSPLLVRRSKRIIHMWSAK